MASLTVGGGRTVLGWVETACGGPFSRWARRLAVTCEAKLILELYGFAPVRVRTDAEVEPEIWLLVGVGSRGRRVAAVGEWGGVNVGSVMVLVLVVAKEEGAAASDSSGDKASATTIAFSPSVTSLLGLSSWIGATVDASSALLLTVESSAALTVSSTRREISSMGSVCCVVDGVVCGVVCCGGFGGGFGTAAGFLSSRLLFATSSSVKNGCGCGAGGGGLREAVGLK